MSIRFSLIVPTLDEAALLATTLESARAAFGDDAEYIVTDGGSTDATCAIAREAGARVVNGTRGRGEQLDRGFRAARGEVCIFLHADTRLPADARIAIERTLTSPDTAGGAFSLDLSASDVWLRLWQRAINLRARLFQTATGDQAIFARRELLAAVGGVPRVPLFEDVRLCRALKRAGRFAILPERVRTSARLWREIGTGRGILLHLTLRALHALGASPVLLARFYPLAR
ncbi:MAG: TIGR04283 family arsenosugar biosynthesis glycosyltransferase [Gemmatimonadota bacterium]